MKKIIDVHSFIDNSIEDMGERCAMWAHDVYAFTERWELVLEAKWNLVSIAQGQIQSEVKSSDYDESNNVGC